MVNYLLVSAILACIFVLATGTGTYRSGNGLRSYRRFYPRRTPRRTFQCNKNEVWSTCTAAVCRPKTCKQVGFPIPCPDLAQNGACPSGPGCICKENFVRDHKGICVPKEFCQICGGDPNARPGCGNCNPLCSNYDRDDIVCTQECRYNACDCKEGYVFDETKKKCVKPSQCPPRITCNRNEVYDVCPSNCPPRTCGINDAAVSCAVSLPFGHPDCPPPACRCKDGFYRNHRGNCVLWKNCPKCKRPREVYDPCPSTCPPNRCDVDPALILCQVQPSLGDPRCKPSCRCVDGFRRNQTGYCIPEDQCPKCIKPNQIFDLCLSCPPRRCDVDERTIRCAAPLKVGDPRCESGCRCIDGYKMDSNGDCIPEGQCPPKCDFNEVYSDCIPNDCKPNTCSQLGTDIDCPIQAAVCRQGCICKEGHVRNDDGVCIPIEQCPPKCNVNELYSDCIPNDCKPETCSELGTKIDCPIQAAVCRQGCICKEGHVRNEDGVCIPIEQCPPKCNVNELYSDCIPNDCKPETCSQLGTKIDCPIQAAVCRQGCICKEGHVRNEDGVCIPIEQCLSCDNDPNKRPGCGVYCNQCCSDRGKEPGACILVCYENACDCREGYFLNEVTGLCVPPEQCPPQCPDFEEFSDCIQNECFPQNCTQLGFPLDCPEVKPAQCKQGCICVEGYARDAKGKCIPVEQCPSCGGDCNKVAGCGVYCNQLCSDIGKLAGECVEVCYENACNCRNGYYLDELTGNCVLPKQCPPQCRTNEIYSDCIQGQCSPQNCSQVGFPMSCPRVRPEACKKGCICKEGHARNDDGYCVPVKECPPQCPKNEFYSTCTQGNCSPENCTQVGLPIACPFVIEKYCKKGCLCKEGFARNSKGVCIPTNECPPVTPACGINEEYSNCTNSHFGPQTCKELGFPVSQVDVQPENCKGGCRCITGHVRNDKGMCIPSNRCPSCGGDPNAKPGCGGNCNKRCSDLGKKPGACTLSCMLNGCDCKDGYYFDDERNKCVMSQDCTPKCPANETFSECINGGCQPRNCSQYGKPVPCVKIDPRYCIPGCVCKENYLRAYNGQCVPAKSCPEACNGPNEEFSACSWNCPPQTCESLGRADACPVRTTDNCQPTCKCKQGFYRNKQGQCVTEQECCTNGTTIAPICGKDEVYEDCKNAVCRPKYCTDLGFPLDCKSGCRKGCVCRDGYVRNGRGVCIPEQYCPSCGGDKNATSGCGQNCGRHCSNIGHGPVACRALCKLNSCDCKEGFYFNDEIQKCVMSEDCPIPTRCPVNERYERCPGTTCEPEYCWQLGFQHACPDQTGNVTCSKKPGCVCIDGYVRDANGRCIPKHECPSCGGDIFAKPGCGVNCGKTCRELGKGPRPCLRICYVDACDCIDGYYYDAHQKKCVLPGQCTDLCDKNEIFEDCTNPTCKAETCSELGFPLDCNKTCKKGCICQNGYVRDANGICVPAEQCPSCGGDENARLGCGTNCNKRCPNCQINPRLCPRIACVPQLNKCECKDGYLFDDIRKKCVKLEDCTPLCNEQNNEVIDSCINGGCEWRNCSQLGGPMLCVDPIKCVQGCSCKKGYYRLEDGTCVPESQCPKKCKGPNEHFNCGTACDNVCGKPEYKYNCPIKNIKCVPMCYCNDGFARNVHGICIPEKDCPQPCRGPNEFFDCGPECDNVCGKKESRLNCPYENIQCNSKCYCRDGFARNKHGICIRIDQCPQACNGPNEEYSACSWNCPPQTCESLGRAYACPMQTTDNCQPTCKCKQGFYRNKQGQCVTEQECCTNGTTIAPICGKDEVYEDCKNAVCRPKYCTDLGFPLDCKSGCRKGCVCRDGYVRDGRGVCIPEQYCPSCGGDKNATSGCGQNCGRHCSNIGQGPVACRALCKLNSCDCKEGFYFNDEIQKCVMSEDCPIPTRCPVNERYERCPGTTCEPEYCWQLGFQHPCPDQTGNVTCSKKPGCVCIDGYVRDANGRCIPKHACPSCGGDIFARSGCGVNCGKTCRELGKGPRPCIRICYVDACDCIDGYYYDAHQKKCVLPGQCTDLCDKNEIFENCTNPTCKAETCSELGFPLDCNKTCKKGCICQNGYVRDANGICVPAEQCPSCGGDENARLGCGTNCNKRCPNCQINPRLCPRIACVPQLNKCECKDGYLFDDIRKKCVKLEDCTPLCNEQNNEVIDSCINGGCGWRNCSQLGGPMLCVDPIKCVQGCSCKKGYYRLEDGTCVPESQCPKKCKGPNEHFNCGTACDNVCGKPEYKYNCPIKNIKCVPMCYCNDGFARNVHGICIPEKDCPQPCRGPNEFFDCGPECDNVCGKKESRLNCPYENIRCNLKCYCRDGFARNKHGICIRIDQCPRE